MPKSRVPKTRKKLSVSKQTLRDLSAKVKNVKGGVAPATPRPTDGCVLGPR